jgi:predicted nucleotidyltransferase
MRAFDEVQLKPNDRAAVERAAQILRQRFPVERLILFGSKARGEDDAESDIDLLVLSSRPLSWRDRDAVMEALFDLQLELEVVFTPVVIPLDEWENGVYQVLPLRKEVERDGVLL